METKEVANVIRKANANASDKDKQAKYGQQKWGLFETNYQRNKGITLEQSLQEIEGSARSGNTSIKKNPNYKSGGTKSSDAVYMNKGQAKFCGECGKKRSPNGKLECPCNTGGDGGGGGGTSSGGGLSGKKFGGSIRSEANSYKAPRKKFGEKKIDLGLKTDTGPKKGLVKAKGKMSTGREGSDYLANLKAKQKRNRGPGKKKFY